MLAKDGKGARPMISIFVHRSECVDRSGRRPNLGLAVEAGRR